MQRHIYLEQMIGWTHMHFQKVSKANGFVDVGFSFCLVLFWKVKYGQFLNNRILFNSKHKLLPVQLTWLPQVCKKVLYFANEHPGVLVFVCHIKFVQN